jgi:hypothetical protein
MVVRIAFVVVGPSASHTLVVRGDWLMKRILSLSSAVMVTLAFGLTGCDSGGDMSEGVPKEVMGQKFEGFKGPNGSKPLSTDMRDHGNKPPAKGEEAKVVPAIPK